MQATSTRIREQQFGQTVSECAEFSARAAQVRILMEQIVKNGSPELHEDSTALCTHFKLRRGTVGMEAAEAQLYQHAAGIVIRLWVYPGDFAVKVRDLLLLPCAGKGYEVWLEADGKVFPHEGKYALAGQQVMMNAQIGR